MSTWVERPVDRESPHLVLNHEDHPLPVALVGPEIDGKLGVEFVVPMNSDDEVLQRVVHDVREDIVFYLDGAGGPVPWEYAIYHCSTAANLYSRVHWGYTGPQEIAP
jgi:hypothetical protein